MRERLRILVAACFFYSGLVRLAYWWKRRRSGQCLMILKYHRASGGDLRSQMLYLSRHYLIQPLEAALEELYRPCKEEKGDRDPRIPLALTFDDGYRDNYTHAFAIACQLQVPITIFLAPGYIESGVRFWWSESDYLVRNAQVNEVTIEGRNYHLDQPEERKALAQTIDTGLYYARSVTQREAFLAEVRKTLGAPLESVMEEDTHPLTWQEVYKMQESGLVSFGAHTMHHPVLACLEDGEELRWEVEKCCEVLEQQLGHPVRTFAYPIGSLKNIGDQGLRAVKAAGYRWAFTTIQEVNTPQTDPYLLKRINGNETTHWMVMASELVGLLPIISRLKRKLRTVLYRSQG